MGKTYQPPYTITPKIINLITQIGESVGKLSIITNSQKDVKLRRINRIKTIHGSLAIEGNSLDEASITDILNGKRVLAPSREIQEVRNALEVYDHFEKWNPKDEKNLLKAHQILMKGLIDEIGNYRSGSVGVLSGKEVIHVAPPADRVPYLMKDLFAWLKQTEDHPIIASCVFHYEFEFIHPFSDGNGRMGRLWQSLILSQWNPLLAYVPVESVVHKHQSEYYKAIQNSTDHTDSSYFIEFILTMLLDAISDVTPQETPQVTPQVKRLVLNLPEDGATREELQSILDLKDRKSFMNRYIQPALADGIIKMSTPDKPHSKLQRYYLTEKGVNLRTYL